MGDSPQDRIRRLEELRLSVKERMVDYPTGSPMRGRLERQVNEADVALRRLRRQVLRDTGVPATDA